MTKTFPDVVERFLRYVKIDTESVWPSSARPSTPGQWDLLRLLERELRELGLREIVLAEHGILTATLPSNIDRDAPAFGLIAHVDTTPEYTGKNVKPQIVENYQGGDIVVSQKLGIVIEQAHNPHLADYLGHDIITTDGSTLLGADDKAGVATIMATLTHLSEHPQIEHGPIKIAFTPDEEIGHGVDTFDVDAFGAVAAYTVDGTGLGDIDNETFCADEAVITITGVPIHPCIAFDRMRNAVQIAAEIVSRWHADERPETTKGRDGFLYFYQVEGTSAKATVRVLVRDFDLDLLNDRGQRLKEHVATVLSDYRGATADVELIEQYRNMRYVLDDCPHVAEYALQAARRAGVEPTLSAIRGGTDGSRLSYMGLPTPNIFNGCHSYHSPTEHVSIQVLHKVVDTLVELAKLWAEPR